MEEELSQLRADLNALKMQCRADVFCRNLLITPVLRAMHEAGILNLFWLQEELDEKFVAVAEQLAIGGADAEMASRGINAAQQILRFASQNLQRPNRH